MTRHNDLVQDFFAALIDAHSRYKMPAAEIVNKVMRYYRTQARYPSNYDEVWHQNKVNSDWMRRKRGQRVKQGKCIYCGQGLLDPYTKMCQTCSDYYRLKNKAKSARRARK